MFTKDNQADRHPSFLRRLFNMGPRPQNSSELDDFISEAGDRAIIDEHTEDMLHGVFDIARLRLDDIMIPRKDIITIDSRCSLLEAVKIIDHYGHSRYPVIDGDKDHVQGILLAKDLLPYTCNLKPFISLEKLLRPTVIVPESKRVDAMLKDFQADRYHMAVVVDEFGGVSGVVTIEDILELIVGDINDEYDEAPDSKMISKVKGSDNYLVKGLTPLDEFYDFFNTEGLPDIGMDTVGGLVLHAFGHFPKPDETTTVGPFTFKVVKSSPKQVHLLLVNYQHEPEE